MNSLHFVSDKNFNNLQEKENFFPSKKSNAETPFQVKGLFRKREDRVTHQIIDPCS